MRQPAVCMACTLRAFRWMRCSSLWVPHCTSQLQCTFLMRPSMLVLAFVTSCELYNCYCYKLEPQQCAASGIRSLTQVATEVCSWGGPAL